MSSQLCIDVAGGATGGAARFRTELLSYLDSRAPGAVRVIGMGRSLSPPWLVQRELAARRDATVALNNVSFVGPSRKTVLLRNALHFLRPDERAEYLHKVKGMTNQIRIVHLACRRADLIVVPTNDMAERVVAYLPGVASRVEVRAHPLTFTPSGAKLENLPDGPFILSPALSAAHKDAATYLRRLGTALERLGRDEVIAVTANRNELPLDLQQASWIWPIGPQRVQDMPDWYARSRAIYFPTSVESFGYPLAESRVSGTPAIAIDSTQNREVAGDVLCGYDDAAGAFERAVTEALDRPAESVRPEPDFFSAVSYFDWLLSTARP